MFRRFQISADQILKFYLAVVEAMLADLPLGAALNQTRVPDAPHPEISHRKVAASYIGLLSQDVFFGSFDGQKSG